MSAEERGTSELLARLLTDAAFRARFREDPAAVSAELGLDRLAAELARTTGELETLEPRESRSSLAGVVLAAAAEGVGVAELARHFSGRGALADDAARALEGAVARIRTDGPAPAPVADAAPAPPVDVPPEPAPPADSHPSPEPAPHPTIVAPVVQDPPVRRGPAAPIAVRDLATRDEGGHLHASEFDVADDEGAPGPHGRRHAGYDLFARPGAPLRAPVAGTVVEVKASRGVSGQIFGGVVKVRADDARVWVFRHVDPAAIAEGMRVEPGHELATVTPWADGPAHAHIELWKTFEGGYAVENMDDPLPELELAYAPAAPDGVTAAAQLLESPALELSDEARADLAAGEVDARLVAVLARLTERHRIGISVFETGHDRLTASGSVSNHFHGRAVDIASVDGEPVSVASAAARELMQELAALPPDLRPTEIGSPWKLAGPEFFTDAAHQDHLHVGYDTEAPAAPPAVVAPPPPAGTFGALPVVPEAATAPAGPNGTLVSVPAVADEVAQAGEPLAYPGDDAPRDAVAAWMAAHARAAGLPGELPVMAGLVESGLRNLDHGHADSVGFFQMRVSIWNSGTYAGYPDRPGLQLRWFVDRALAVRAQRLAAGLPDPTGDPTGWGEWVADIERPAEQYRGRYQERLAEARQLLGLPI